jgi:hypothetical protein
MYAIVRSDLVMTAGKAASQAGHAFLDSFLTAPPDLTKAYLTTAAPRLSCQSRTKKSALRPLPQANDGEAPMRHGDRIAARHAAVL